MFEVMPGTENNLGKLNMFVFGKISEDKILGNFIHCYTGYAKDEKIRHESSSGGTVTALLIYLLESKQIDGALVTRMSSQDPLKPEVFLAKTKKEILEAKGSKYAPAPLNIGIKRLEKEKGKFAVVGLPCHIEGIRKIQLLKPELRKKIVLCLGLVCAKTVNFTGTEMLLKLYGIKKEEVKKISYRGNGWPGKLKIVTEKKEIERDFFDYFSFFNQGFFVPSCCFLCSDFANELADISFADAWVADFIKRDKEGTNIIITRTKKGEELLQKTKKSIYFEQINPERVKKITGFLIKKTNKSFLRPLSIIFNSYWPLKQDKSEVKTSFFLKVSLFSQYFNSLITEKFPDFFLKLPKSFWTFQNWTNKKIYTIYKKVIKK